MFNVADAVRNGLSLDIIKKEIKKCSVLCANCHAIRHFNMRNKKHTSPRDRRGARETQHPPGRQSRRGGCLQAVVWR